ncbi:hypothetical protein F4861DRAFT_213562 [Xylaria intraflava]|nr:hypothetical protein F4861DRAFT_213562 [Xylaria intraflava]
MDKIKPGRGGGGRRGRHGHVDMGMGMDTGMDVDMGASMGADMGVGCHRVGRSIKLYYQYDQLQNPTLRLPTIFPDRFAVMQSDVAKLPPPRFAHNRNQEAGVEKNRAAESDGLVAGQGNVASWIGCPLVLMVFIPLGPASILGLDGGELTGR